MLALQKHIGVRLVPTSQPSMAQHILPDRQPAGTERVAGVQGTKPRACSRRPDEWRAAAARGGELESAYDFAIIGTDASGAITVWNTGAEHLFGHAEHEALNRGIGMVFTPEDQAAGVVEAEKRRALEQGRAEDEWWHLRRDGSVFWGSGLMMPMASPDGGFVKVVRDRTVQRQAEERLAQAE